MFQLPRDCRVFTKLQPAVQWGWGEILANKTVYLLETLVWMNTKDAQKKFPQHRPKLFTPDFMPQHSAPGEISNGAVIRTTEDIRDVLSKPRA